MDKKIPELRGKAYLAGNYDEFLIWAREHKVNPNTSNYLSSVERIMGLQDVDITLIGTWYKECDVVNFLVVYGPTHGFKTNKSKELGF